MAFCQDSLKPPPKLMQIDGTLISPGAPKTKTAKAASRLGGAQRSKSSLSETQEERGAVSEGGGSPAPGGGKIGGGGLSQFKKAVNSTTQTNRFAAMFAAAGAEQAFAFLISLYPYILIIHHTTKYTSNSRPFLNHLFPYSEGGSQRGDSFGPSSSTATRPARQCGGGDGAGGSRHSRGVPGHVSDAGYGADSGGT